MFGGRPCCQECNLQVGYILGPENKFPNGFSRPSGRRLMIVGTLGTVDGLLKAISDDIPGPEASQAGSQCSKAFEVAVWNTSWRSVSSLQKSLSSVYPIISELSQETAQNVL
jgi:hypothetical protein